MTARTANRDARIAELRQNQPPVFDGPIRSLDDLRAAMRRGLWATELTALISPDGNTGYLRGKCSIFREFLDRLDWPDACDKCGKSPPIDRIEEFALCHECVDDWCAAQDMVDGETA